MTQRLRAFDPESGEWHWLEFEDDGEPLRHIVFFGDEPIVAGRTADRLALRDRFGSPGNKLYEAVFGAACPPVAGPTGRQSVAPVHIGLPLESPRWPGQAHLVDWACVRTSLAWGDAAQRLKATTHAARRRGSTLRSPGA